MAVPFRIGVLQLSMEPVAETVAMAQAANARDLTRFGLRKRILVAKTFL